MLAINEVFLSYQGEGTLTGVKMYFIRTQGCAVGCYFCDTKQTWKAEQQTTDEEKMVDFLDPKEAKWVCITGGEPLEQDLSKLVKLLKDRGFSVQLETSGMYFDPILHQFDYVVVSPKTLFSKKPINEQCVNLADELKCVVTKESDIEYYLTLAKQNQVAELIFQCVDNNPELAQEILKRKDLVDWKLMAQQQKVLNLR